MTKEVYQTPGVSVDRSPELSLADKAKGLERAAVMKYVVGPCLSDLLRPIYAPDISEVEGMLLTGDCRFPTSDGEPRGFKLEVFSGITKGILWDRLGDARNGDGKKQYVDFLRFSDGRTDLFYYGDAAADIIPEGLQSGIVVPLRVATQVHRLEYGDRKSQRSHRLSRWALCRPDELIEIMERPCFDDILLHLTKGPNGFLGEKAVEVTTYNSSFFDFKVGADPERRLSFRDAYEMADGKVVGLSGAYHVSARQMRTSVLRTHSSKSAVDPRTHQVWSHSGCPVRHSFEDESGEKQEPLIIAAKKFLVAALSSVGENMEVVRAGLDPVVAE